jgi:cyclic pyranopterin phosphate synthase
MPEEGLKWLSRKELMSYEEMLRICSLLVDMGIDKVRITGGEPFVRKDILQLLTAISNLNGLRELSITTNGVLTAPYVAHLKDIGVKSVNLSLDTLDPDRFFAITRRNEFSNVMKTLDSLLHHHIEVKINSVVMEGKNTQDIISLAALTKDLPVSVRFIEEMPFNGADHNYSGITWNYVRIMEELSHAFPEIRKIPDPEFSTANNYQINGHVGQIGIIAGYSRTFCGTCNRIRLTPMGMLKTCLYDNGVLNIRDAVRNGLDNSQLRHLLSLSLASREINGWDVENKRLKGPHESMASIGG